ncbi:RCS-specific HTH-type transcriptional activator RclR [Pararobbsia alpina]
MLLKHGDALSEALKRMRPRVDTVFRGELGVSTEVSFAAGPAAFLHMLDGQAWISQPDGECVSLRPGDFVLVLNRDGFTLHDQPNGTERRRFEAHPSLAENAHGQGIRWAANDTIAASFLAGAFHFNGRPLCTLLSGLPGLVQLSRDGAGMPPWLATMSHFLNEEANNVGPGSSFVIPRVIELLVTGTLRAWICSQGERLGWLAGLSDERIGRALNAMHLDPARAWTVESLAEIATMSRSIFSERFTAAVGVPPRRYLTRWRLTVAADLLRAGTSKVIEVAHEAGYGSEAAFSRAFKAQFGYPPRDTRHVAQAEIVAPAGVNARHLEHAAHPEKPRV